MRVGAPHPRAGGRITAPAETLPPLAGGAIAAIVALVLLDAPLVLFAGMLLFGTFQSGGFPESFYAFVMLAAALAPLVVLLGTRGRKPGLAWGIFLMGFVVAFGACVMFFSEML